MNKEKDNYLTKSEMLEFLKKKKILVDSDTKNFPRFARKHGIISKKGNEVSPNGVVALVYKKPSQEKILEILEKLRNTNNSLMGRKIVREKKKLVITVFDTLMFQDPAPGITRVKSPRNNENALTIVPAHELALLQ